jgi:hypothetical protein
MKLGTVGIRLAADLGAADATGSIVLGAVGQNEKQVLPYQGRRPAPGTEQARRFEITEAVHD